MTKPRPPWKRRPPPKVKIVPAFDAAWQKRIREMHKENPK